jgi:predicted phosphodiesterase
MDFALELARSFDVDLVLDTGDTSSFGTAAESIILDRVPEFERPYVWVRGNHDSPAFQQVVASRPNAVVLDGDIARVGGLTIYGLGDPLFTAERGAPLESETIADLVRSVGPRIAEDLEGVVPAPDIVAVHDDRMAESVAGRVPLVVSGHFHRESIEIVSGTVYLQVGTTGGAGPTGFTAEGGVPLSAEILYFRRSQTGEPPALIAWDVITQLPETGSLQIERHLVAEELGVPSPSPTVTARATTTGSTLSPTSASP